MIDLKDNMNFNQKAEQAYANIGVSLSMAINIYLKKLGREKSLLFKVFVDLFYS